MAENYQKKELLSLMAQPDNKCESAVDLSVYRSEPHLRPPYNSPPTPHLPLPTTTNQSRTPLSPTFSACVDCGTPSPQWASVSYGTYVCLECSGAHRGLGVHLSFIRSLTMDKWSDDQMNKMRFGGNRAFKEFMEGYVKEEGGWRKGMGIQEKYKTWAAAQYREKVRSIGRATVVFSELKVQRHRPHRSSIQKSLAGNSKNPPLPLISTRNLPPRPTPPPPPRA